MDPSKKEMIEICTPSSVLHPHPMYQKGSMSAEARQVELPAVSGPGSGTMRDRARMKK